MSMIDILIFSILSGSAAGWSLSFFYKKGIKDAQKSLNGKINIEINLFNDDLRGNKIQDKEGNVVYLSDYRE